MAATTYATFYNTFKNMSLSGVTSLDEPPLSVPSANLPCKWVEEAGQEEGPFIVGQTGGWPTLSARVVVLMKPYGQDRHSTRWSDALTMIDTLAAGIRALTVPTKGPLTFAISLERNFEGSSYLAVIATVSGEG